MASAQSPRRSAPDPAADVADPALTRVQAPRGAPRIAATMWLLAVFVVVAVLKPWGGGGQLAATLRPDVAVPVDSTPVPTRDRSATGLAVDVCLGAGAWRIATLETWRNRDVRVWRAIEPLAVATGPLDPAIPAVPVVADVLTGLGWCAPAFGADQPVGPANVRAWQVVDGVSRPVSLRQVQPADGITPIAALYLPASAAWTTSLVVFQYTDQGANRTEWFAADLRILEASPSPSPAADAPTIAAP